MARTEIWIVDDANPSGAWQWIGGYEGTGSGSGATITPSVVSSVAAVLAPGAVSGSSASVSPAAISATGAVPTPTVSTATAQFLSLPGATGAMATVPDETALDLTGTHTVRMRIRKADWTPVPNGGELVLGKWGASGQWGFNWQLDTVGQLGFNWTNDGTNNASEYTATPGTTPTVDVWLWVQLKVLSSNRLVTYSTHADQEAEPTTGWTEIATSASGSSTGAIFNSTAVMSIGSQQDGSYRPTTADIRQLLIRNEADTLVFSLDPDNWTTGTTWVSDTGQTVTLAGSATIGSE